MIQVTTRHRKAMAFLLFVAAACMIWTKENPRRFDPCRQPAAISVTSLISGSTHKGSRNSNREDVTLWVEGTFENPLSNEAPFRYQIIRSYDLLHQSARPVNLVSDKIDAEHHRVENLEIDGQTVPVHIVEDYTTTPNRLIAYLHIHGIDPTESLFSDQLGRLPEIVRTGA
ncbi:MAG: hypothetical protein GY946_07625, partial [bacterium]|nr:hypothetical protein [bacterium]